MLKIVAAFVSPTWLDRACIRAWVQTLSDHSRFVLITADSTDGNAVLARELRCSCIVSAVVWMQNVVGGIKSVEDLREAQRARDEMMAEVAAEVFDFGEMPGGAERFAGKKTTVFKPGG
jgi:hypothetical protein